MTNEMLVLEIHRLGHHLTMSRIPSGIPPEKVTR
jgi:hypothetical protein